MSGWLYLYLYPVYSYKKRHTLYCKYSVCLSVMRFHMSWNRASASKARDQRSKSVNSQYYDQTHSSRESCNRKNSRQAHEVRSERSQHDARHATPRSTTSKRLAKEKKLIEEPSTATSKDTHVLSTTNPQNPQQTQKHPHSQKTMRGEKCPTPSHNSNPSFHG